MIIQLFPNLTAVVRNLWRYVDVSALSLILTIVSTTTLAQSTERIKTYDVKKTSIAPMLSGKGDDPQWKTAAVLTDFQFPWEEEKPHPTTFRALHDEKWVYFLFDIIDPAVHVEINANHKMEVAASSRAEIFFKADDRLDPYYCLELDPNARVLDYEARHYRKFNVDWSWPEGHFAIKTHRRNDGYTVEFAITKESLTKLGLLKNGVLQAGIFRADCTPRPDREPDFKWASWVKPDSDIPDFHIPSSFGILKLE